MEIQYTIHKNAGTPDDRPVTVSDRGLVQTILGLLPAGEATPLPYALAEYGITVTAIIPQAAPADLLARIKALPRSDLLGITLAETGGTTRCLAHSFGVPAAEVARAFRRLAEDGWLVEAGAGTYSPAREGQE